MPTHTRFPCPTIFGIRYHSCGITLTLLLTLTGINYCSTEALPNLPYSTALDRYHDAAHAFVFACIAQVMLPPPSLLLALLLAL